MTGLGTPPEPPPSGLGTPPEPKSGLGTPPEPKSGLGTPPLEGAPGTPPAAVPPKAKAPAAKAKAATGQAHTPESIARLPPKLRERLVARGIIQQHEVDVALALNEGVKLFTTAETVIQQEVVAKVAVSPAFSKSGAPATFSKAGAKAGSALPASTPKAPPGPAKQVYGSAPVLYGKAQENNTESKRAKVEKENEIAEPPAAGEEPNNRKKRRKEKQAASASSTAQPQEAPQEKNLPPGWYSAVDDASGLTYYYNPDTGGHQWERPVDSSVKKADPLFGLPPAGYVAGVGRGATGFVTEEGQMKAAEQRQTPSIRIIEEAPAPGPAKVEDFQASKTFQGAREGYIFTTRSQGTGYYLDVGPMSVGGIVTDSGGPIGPQTSDAGKGKGKKGKVPRRPDGDPKGPALPPGWVTVPHEDSYYYWNTQTNEVVWELPGIPRQEKRGGKGGKKYEEFIEVAEMDLAKMIGKQGYNVRMIKASIGCDIHVPKGSKKGKGKGKDKGKKGKDKDGGQDAGLEEGDRIVKNGMVLWRVKICSDSAHEAKGGKKCLEIMLGFGRDAQRALKDMGVDVVQPPEIEEKGNKNKDDELDPMDPAAYGENVPRKGEGKPRKKGGGRIGHDVPESFKALGAALNARTGLGGRSDTCHEEATRL